MASLLVSIMTACVAPTHDARSSLPLIAGRYVCTNTEDGYFGAEGVLNLLEDGRFRIEFTLLDRWLPDAAAALADARQRGWPFVATGRWRLDESLLLNAHEVCGEKHEPPFALPVFLDGSTVVYMGPCVLLPFNRQDRR